MNATIIMLFNSSYPFMKKKILFCCFAVALMLSSTLVTFAQSESSAFVGTVQPVWKNQPVVGPWLTGRYPTSEIPDYLSQTDFPHPKNFADDIPFTDRLTVVRLLGGWDVSTLGKGEAKEYTDISEADLVYRKFGAPTEGSSDILDIDILNCDEDSGSCTSQVKWDAPARRVQLWFETGGVEKLISCASPKNSKDISWTRIGKEYTFTLYESEGCSKEKRGAVLATMHVQPTELEYRWDKMKDRLDPLIERGYKDLTIVLDNIPYALTNSPTTGPYGQTAPPTDLSEWSVFIEEMTSQLVQLYGLPTVNNFRFRLGTENQSHKRFSGTPEEYLALYEATVKAVKSVAPRAKIGPYNQAGVDSSTDKLTHTYLLENIADRGDIDFWPYSLYYIMKKHTSGINNAHPSQRFPDYENLWADFSSGSIEIQEHGVLSNEYGVPTGEPGVRGAALHAQTLFQVLKSGVDGIWHWSAFEKVSHNKESVMVPKGLTWLYSLFEETIGTKAYTLAVETVAKDDVSVEAMGFKEDDYKQMVMISSYDPDRNVSADKIQSVTLTLPEWFTQFDANTRIQFVSLDKQNDLHTEIRNDFEEAGLLAADFLNIPGESVGTVMAMGGVPGRKYVFENWGRYKTNFIESLTLQKHRNPVTKTSSGIELTLELRTPSVHVLLIDKDCNVNCESLEMNVPVVDNNADFANELPADDLMQQEIDAQNTLLRNRIMELIALVEELRRQLHIKNEGCSVHFTKDLEYGMEDAEVFLLQQMLNRNNFIVANEGPGSPGMETQYFGYQTMMAVQKWQNHNYQSVLQPFGIPSGTGYWGTESRNHINNACNAG